MGRGRSTIGMIAIYLLIKQHARYMDATGHAGQLRVHHHAARDEWSHVPPAPAALPPFHSDGSHAPSDHDGLAAYRRGDFDIMLRLVRLLRAGRSAKARVDEAIDRCGRVHHLRDQIVESFIASEHERASDAHQMFSAVTAGYMKRYFLLVCFQAYLEDASEALAHASGALPAAGTPLTPGVSSPSSMADLDPSSTFTAWWAAHPELPKLMATLMSLLQIVPSTATAVTVIPPGDLKSSGSDEALALVKAAEAAVPSMEAGGTDSCSVLDSPNDPFSRASSFISARVINVCCSNMG
jgi:hypothetical protein